VLWTILEWTAVIAAAPIVVMLVFGRWLVFPGTSLSEVQVYSLSRAPGWTFAPIESGGLRLNGLVRAATPTAPWVLYFGGNGYDLATSQSILDDIRGEAPWGLAVWAYRGYDGSGGSASEDGLVADARAAARTLEERWGVRPASLVIVGQSIGSGVACALAADLSREGTPPAALVLISPFTSIRALFEERVPIIPVGWAVRDPFASDRRLAELGSTRVLIIHGDRDSLIPIAHGRRLAEALGDRATLLELPGRGHNDVWLSNLVLPAVRGQIEAASN